MKSDLKRHYQDKIIITEINGKQNVVSFHTTASKILHNFRQSEMDTQSDEKKLIIEAAAKFIKQDTKDISQERDNYPTVDNLSPEKALEYLPPSLQQFLKIIICGKNAGNKTASIGQAIMQAAHTMVESLPELQPAVIHLAGFHTQMRAS